MVWVAHATKEVRALQPFFFLAGMVGAGGDWEGGHFEEEAVAGATLGAGVAGTCPTMLRLGSVVTVAGGCGGAALLSARH